MAETQRYVGRPLKRVEDPKLITGRGQYVEDLALPGVTALAFVRSPHAHARVRGIRADRARAVPGVLCVVTAKDLGPLRPTPYMATVAGLKAVPFQCLASDVVDSTGVPVAAIVAESVTIALEAAQLIEVDYDPLPAVIDPEQALTPGAPLVHPEIGTNEAFRVPMKGGDVTTAFARAAHVVRVRAEHNRIAGAPMEPRAVAARYDAGSGELTVWSTTQNPFLARADLAAMLGFPEHRLRVVAPDVGGGFGVKGPVYREEVVAASMAIELRRPVRWISTRNEDLLTTLQARAAVTDAEAAISAEGEILGLKATTIFDLGAHLLSLSIVPPLSYAIHVMGPYRLRNVELTNVGVYTNTAPTGPYRGSGRPVGVYVIERVVDEAARVTGIDPVEIRRRNFIPPDAFPYRTALGVAYDSGHYGRALDRVVELADYPALRRQQAEARTRGEIVGIGVAAYVESTNVLGWESGVVRIERSGKITAVTGSSPHGQGHETTFAQIIADRLGVDWADVVVRHGDTQGAPQSIGTFGSRSAGLGGSALAQASLEVREKGRRLAAHLLEASVDDVEPVRGGFQVKGTPDRIVSWDRLGDFAHRGMGLPASESPGLESTVFFRQDHPAWSFGAGLAVVRIDPDTGHVRLLRFIAVDDCGNAINPLLVDGQIVGALAQGIGQALMEHVVYGEAGQLITATFMEYAMPRADDMPDLALDRTVTPSPFNPLGAKGVGEGGACVAPPAIVNAVVDALSPFGVRHVDMPLTAEKIWRAMRRRSSPAL
ncbi:MAG TPA: xanthine dehydrogenase family protein molybdopterin-binding subunit [Candidatus Methylomirabilis sp.]|nr:xanthine dehydrogenase family protein molybdopterin-binding subunit [Candidatus Methylomirabilis sp.]